MTVTVTTKKGNSRTYELLNQKTFQPAKSKKEAHCASGGTCVVYVAQYSEGNERRKCLLKEYKFEGEYLSNQAYENISKIINCFQSEGTNYLLRDDFFGEGCFSGEDKKKWFHAYDYTAPVDINKMHPCTGSIFDMDNILYLYQIIKAYLGLLVALDIMHRNKWLHGDLKTANVHAFDVNHELVAQMLDFGSMKSFDDAIEEICETGDFILDTEEKWYRSLDIYKINQYVQKGRTDMLYVLDTTAATRILSEWLTGYTDFINITEAEQDQSFVKNQEFFSKLESFLKKGTNSNIENRFRSVGSMIEQIKAILRGLETKFPVDIASEKMKACGNGNRVVDNLKKRYITRHELNERVHDISIRRLKDEIVPSILPNIRLFPQRVLSYEKRGNVSPLQKLLEQTEENYLITSSAGSGKTTSLVYEFLRMLYAETNELYIYLPLTDYTFDQELTSFIDSHSGFRFSKLIKTSPDKITVFLDAYDEIETSLMSIDNRKINEQENFWAQIKKLSNVRFIITSRCESEAMPNSFRSAEFCELTDAQIKEYLGEDYRRIQSIYSTCNHLSKNSMFLLMIRRLIQNHRITNGIVNEIQLIELYLAEIFESKNGKGTSKEKIYSEVIQYLYQRASAPILHESDRVYAIEHFAKGLQSIVSFENYRSGVKLVFSHSIFKEYLQIVAFFDTWKQLTLLLDDYYKRRPVERRGMVQSLIQHFNSLISQFTNIDQVRLSNYLPFLYILHSGTDGTYIEKMLLFIKKHREDKMWVHRGGLNDTVCFISLLVRTKECVERVNEEHPLWKYAGCHRCQLNNKDLLRDTGILYDVFWKNCDAVWLPQDLKKIVRCDFSNVKWIHYNGSMEHWIEIQGTADFGLEIVNCLDGFVSYEHSQIGEINKYVFNEDISFFDVKDLIVDTMSNMYSGQINGVSYDDQSTRRELIRYFSKEYYLIDHAQQETNNTDQNLQVERLGSLLRILNYMSDTEFDCKLFS